MKRFIIAPDSFKGTMTATEVCSVIEDAIIRHIPDAEITKLPMSDGGEGMTQSYLNICGGKRITARVTGPHNNPVDAEYAILPDGTAVIEMAAAAGLELAWGSKDVQERNPMHTTTKGVGELILHAIDNCAKNVILGLGGSSTNDGGIGMATALGWKFLDKNNNEVEPTGAGLDKIAEIQKPTTQLNINIHADCDVDNPLCGPNGAAHTFGPQKGATKEQVITLNKGLQNLAEVIKKSTGKDVLNIPGAGAAGGLGAGVIAFANGSLHSGIDTLLDAAGYDEKLNAADLVITGEGKIDGQSIHGKVPVGVAKRAKSKGVPCVALCGCIGENAEEVYNYGLTAIFSSLKDSLPDFKAVQTHSKANLEQLADAVIRLLTIAK